MRESKSWDVRYSWPMIPWAVEWAGDGDEIICSGWEVEYVRPMVERSDKLITITVRELGAPGRTKHAVVKLQYSG